MGKWDGRRRGEHAVRPVASGGEKLEMVGGMERDGRESRQSFAGAMVAQVTP
jgi:hypothetical protein